MHPIRPIDPVITFRNSQGEAVRGTLTNVQRRSLVVEIYNPYSIVQVSEVLSDLNVRSGERSIYKGKAVVTSLLNTGLMAVVSVVLIDEWSDLNVVRGDLSRVADEAQRFVEDWESRFRIGRSYQVAISEFRAFLAETARWADQADMSDVLPRDADGRIRADVFHDLAKPIMQKGNEYFIWLQEEGCLVQPEDSVVHRNFAQTALHPLLLRAPFVYRTFAKPLGYAGDYEMVNQIIGDPRQGNSTYFQIINSFFLKAAVAEAHRNRIDILVDYLMKAAATAQAQGRQVNILNVGCGPAVEIQRFIEQHPNPDSIAFTLMDFSEVTLDYTKARIQEVSERTGKKVAVKYVNESVHQLLKRASRRDDLLQDTTFDFVYCAGLFDYLSDKVCSRLLQYFVSRTSFGGTVMVTNVHARNPHKNVMEHLLEWHLIYRDEASFAAVLPEPRDNTRLFTDETGVNIFAEFQVPKPV
ncbi:MAG: methyltransferase domain-containing protein [Polaromonas sp.]|uniref:methyltransferase domain-containing protein n=1 Tax=Polaromonas sp. TaxID=1869339 RepID=UPI00272F22A9|nr:methyltransferase domain-containing protein [Polaromonas sp.]MDP2257987.1 methyltransferase domain-containing protein [Polaromonas sp.]MDP3709694.1 methyltransferase domain-containing protein [Polaromonas sp.]